MGSGEPERAILTSETERDREGRQETQREPERQKRVTRLRSEEGEWWGEEEESGA